MKQIYLDHAAATPVAADVFKAMEPFFSSKFYNPSALYANAQQVKKHISSARTLVADSTGVRPAEVIFTAGGTEANNLAIQGIARKFPNAHFVYSALEHESVREPINWLTKNGWTASEVLPAQNGIVTPVSIGNVITDSTVLVSVMYANNEIGTIQPIQEIAKILQSIRVNRKARGITLPLYFHTDACQAGNYLSLNLHKLGVDVMTLNGGKIYGPKQSGALVALRHVKFSPLLFGGGQEQNMRSGTENVAAIVGFALALKEAQSCKKDESKRHSTLRDGFIDKLLALSSKISVNGDLKHRLPNNIHITVAGSDNERLLFALDEEGIQAATGSACSASNSESSHVLRAIGLNDEQARASLRFTIGRETKSADLRRVSTVLKQLL